MDVKEYLNQAKVLDARINSYIYELEYWRDLLTRLSACGAEASYNSNRSTEPRFVKCIEKINEIEQDINAQVDELVDLKSEINKAVSQLDDPEQQLVLRYRYCECRTWNDIARLTSMSLRSVHRVHGEALKKICVPA